MDLDSVDAAESMDVAPGADSAAAWNVKAKAGLALAQSSFSQNWSGDEVGTVSWLSSADFLAQKRVHPKLDWSNTLVMSFGQTHQQDAEREAWLAPKKSADKIDYDGVVRFTLGGWVDPFFALTFDSQFFQKPAGLSSKALNPIQLGESAGIARAFYDTKSRTLVSRLGFGFRQRHDRFAELVPGAKKTTNDGGIEWRTNGRFASAGDRTVLKSELKMFQAVFFSEKETDLEDDWQEVDVFLQNILSHQLYKWVTLDLYLEFLYDKQQSKAGQLKQTLGLGLTWQLI